MVMMLAPPLAGWVADATGAVGAVLWLGVAMVAGAMAALGVFARLQRARPA